LKSSNFEGQDTFKEEENKAVEPTTVMENAGDETPINPKKQATDLMIEDLDGKSVKSKKTSKVKKRNTLKSKEKK